MTGLRRRRKVKPRIHSRFGPKSGQVALFLVFVVVGIFTLVILNVDVWAAITGKNRTQNAGDAAALAAARVQGIALNELGKLNLEHVVACLNYDDEQIARILGRQMNIMWTRPLEGFRAAQDAAKKNGMKPDREFAAILGDRAAYLAAVAESTDGYRDNPFFWAYVGELNQLSVQEIYAAPDNAEFIDPNLPHMLLDQEFYRAVNGMDWCWFHFNAMSLLTGYNSYADWGALPDNYTILPDECEINKLNVRMAGRDILSLLREEGGSAESAAQKLVDLLAENGFTTTAGGAAITADLIITNRYIGTIQRYDMERNPVHEVWCLYKDRWGAWTEIDPQGEDRFPVVGQVKEEFNVSGCGASYRVHEPVTNITLNTTKEIEWIAAAKPFGFVGEEGDREVVTKYGNLVLPQSFKRARLIPSDAIPGGVFGMSSPEWVRHIIGGRDAAGNLCPSHLAVYYDRGPDALPGNCGYCRALKVWEVRAFREQGVTWLKLYSDTCRRPTGHGGHRGGTHHGH